MSIPIKTIEWKNDSVVMLDQRKLPTEEVYNTYTDYKGVADAIRQMVIRGAPAIGVAAAMGIAVGSLGIGVNNVADFYEKILKICDSLAETRPTAVNLFWAIERMKKVCRRNEGGAIADLQSKLKAEALAIYDDDIAAGRAMGAYGQTLFADGDAVLTHCNAGALATAGYGTALGVLYAAKEAGKYLKVYADETRPFLQGARLTAWELQKNGVDVTVITDNMAGYLMRQGKISKVIVGADRIAANGDVANKIGTYSVALLARAHKIPFYVAAPLSTFDPTKKDGSEIPIEERSPAEVTHVGNSRIVPTGVPVENPSFDVTPNELITAIITENGILRAPYNQSTATLFQD